MRKQQFDVIIIRLRLKTKPETKAKAIVSRKNFKEKNTANSRGYKIVLGNQQFPLVKDHGTVERG